MTKYRGFLRKAGLCLCLVFALQISACSVFKPAGTVNETGRNYRLTLLLMPGYDRYMLYSVLPDIVGSSPPDRALFSAKGPQTLTFNIRLKSEVQLQEIRFLLDGSGIIIKDLDPRKLLIPGN